MPRGTKEKRSEILKSPKGFWYELLACNRGDIAPWTGLHYYTSFEEAIRACKLGHLDAPRYWEGLKVSINYYRKGLETSECILIRRLDPELMEGNPAWGEISP